VVRLSTSEEKDPLRQAVKAPMRATNSAKPDNKNVGNSYTERGNLLAQYDHRTSLLPVFSPQTCFGGSAHYP
jgi:hypothetical protein